jgi:hypothetical protein
MSVDNQPTPGRWQYDGGIVVDERGQTVLKADRVPSCRIPPWQRDNNVRFAAQAPQMYEALQRALPLLIRLGDFIGNQENRCETILEIRNVLEAAIPPGGGFR